MRVRSLALALYVGVVIAAGMVALAWVAGQWQQVELEIWELAVFVALAASLDLMVVPMAGGGGVAVSFAALFAGLLVLGPGPTAWVAAGVAAFSEGVVRRRGLVRVSFNASHGALSLVCAGWVLGILGGKVGNVSLTAHVPAIVGAAICLWLLESTWVAVAVALERASSVPSRSRLSGFGARLGRRLKLILGPAAVVDGGLASVGLLLAMLYQHREALVGDSGWSVAGILFLGTMVLIPCGLLYYAYRLQGHLRRVYSQSLRTLGALLEAKVEGSQPGHGERVSELAARLAEVLELPPQQVEQLRYAGYLHDIGKVAAPLSLLQGGAGASLPGGGGLRLHPQIGAGILQPVGFLQPAAQMVQSHHERWDGLGYPEALRQAEIPLGARILALANACVGMTESGLQPPQALSRLQQAARSRFDPQLLPALQELLSLPG